MSIFVGIVIHSICFINEICVSVGGYRNTAIHVLGYLPCTRSNDHGRVVRANIYCCFSNWGIKGQSDFQSMLVTSEYPKHVTNTFVYL